MQGPSRTGIVVTEEIGADRMPESGIVYDKRDVLAGAFAGAHPARADFWTFVTALVDAVVRTVRLG